MPRFAVTITQTEVRTWTLEAPTAEAAEALAQEWNERPTGDTPEGAQSYRFGYTAQTVTETA